MGGTIASLRGYIEQNGGKVIVASVMTAHEGSLNLAIKPKMLSDIYAKHGEQINEFWTKEFGYGIDKLTQAEAGRVRASASIDALRIRITNARYVHLNAMDGAGNKEAQTTKGATNLNEQPSNTIETEREKGFQKLISSENLHEDKTRDLIEDYLFSEREPLLGDILALRKDGLPSALERREIGNRILNKLLEHINSFSKENINKNINLEELKSSENNNGFD